MRSTQAIAVFSTTPPHTPEFARSIPSDLSRVHAVCRDVEQFLLEYGEAECVFAVVLLLREFINNASIHGNKLNVSKRVDVGVRICRQRIVIRIMDEGPGFDWRGAQALGLPDVEAVSGRGLPIAGQYAQRMRYNHAGNQVVLWIAREPPQQEEMKMVDCPITRTGATARVTLPEQLTAVEAPALQVALKQEIAQGVREIEFDLTHTKSLDSTGIGLLIAASNSLAALQGSVRLIQVSPPLLKLLQSMRLVERLHAVPVA